MTALYLVLFIVGIAFLGLSLFGADTDHDGIFDFMDSHHGIGDAHDVHHGTDSPKLFSVRAIAAFFLGFGMTGLVCVWTHKSVLAQLGFGFLSGVVVAALAWLIMYVMFKQQAGEPLDSATLVGKKGVVSTAPGEQGIGELHIDNKYYTFKEKDGKPIKLNDIAIVEKADAGLLTVTKL